MATSPLEEPLSEAHQNLGHSPNGAPLEDERPAEVESQQYADAEREEAGICGVDSDGEIWYDISDEEGKAEGNNEEVHAVDGDDEGGKRDDNNYDEGWYDDSTEDEGGDVGEDEGGDTEGVTVSEDEDSDPYHLPKWKVKRLRADLGESWMLWKKRRDGRRKRDRSESTRHALKVTSEHTRLKLVEPEPFDPMDWGHDLPTPRTVNDVQPISGVSWIPITGNIRDVENPDQRPIFLRRQSVSSPLAQTLQSPAAHSSQEILDPDMTSDQESITPFTPFRSSPLSQWFQSQPESTTSAEESDRESVVSSPSSPLVQTFESADELLEVNDDPEGIPLRPSSPMTGISLPVATEELSPHPGLPNDGHMFARQLHHWTTQDDEDRLLAMKFAMRCIDNFPALRDNMRQYDDGQKLGSVDEESASDVASPGSGASASLSGSSGRESLWRVLLSKHEMMKWSAIENAYLSHSVLSYGLDCCAIAGNMPTKTCRDVAKRLQYINESPDLVPNGKQILEYICRLPEEQTVQPEPPEKATKGEFVIEYIGAITSKKETVRRERLLPKELRYAMSLSPDKRKVDATYSQRVDVDPTQKGNKARYINEGDDTHANNLFIANTHVRGNLRLGLYALDAIAPGEELFMDYGQEFGGSYMKEKTPPTSKQPERAPQALDELPPRLRPFGQKLLAMAAKYDSDNSESAESEIESQSEDVDRSDVGYETDWEDRRERQRRRSFGGE
ncbi:Histone-lysine N-methyltransferase ezh1 [Rhizophlyctis rosea]|nr:Histone-lysine N-methyltransferase ezh1 [Rhizophlyctis rosea]